MVVQFQHGFPIEGVPEILADWQNDRWPFEEEFLCFCFFCLVFLFTRRIDAGCLLSFMLPCLAASTRLEEKLINTVVALFAANVLVAGDSESRPAVFVFCVQVSAGSD